jgi:hypothetical protein
MPNMPAEGMLACLIANPPALANQAPIFYIDTRDRRYLLTKGSMQASTLDCANPRPLLSYTHTLPSSLCQPFPAGTPEAAISFLQDLVQGCRPAADAELTALTALKRSHTGDAGTIMK